MARKQRTGRFSWLGKNTPQPITNENLVCHDCAFQIKGNTSQCEQFKVQKPNAVLLGENCEKHKKESSNAD